VKKFQLILGGGNEKKSVKYKEMLRDKEESGKERVFR
jgi:hypothetical protein